MVPVCDGGLLRIAERCQSLTDSQLPSGCSRQCMRQRIMQFIEEGLEGLGIEAG